MRINPSSKAIGIGLAVIIGALGISRLMSLSPVGYPTARDEGFRPVKTESANPESIESPSTPKEPPAPTTGLHEGTIRVYVSGQVKRPSVMTIPSSFTAYDAIQKAGGLTGKADAERVNLAGRLSDGQQLYVPAKGQSVLPAAQGSSSKSNRADTNSRASSNTASDESGQMVNINTAELAELDKLPGIGPVLAQRIIDYRTQNGNFGSVDDLLEVKGIGPVKLEKMRACIEL